jgi:hypothetical protein
MTIIDRFIENDDLTRALMRVDEVQGLLLVENRRIHTFKPLWKETGLSREMVLESVEDVEEKFLGMYDHHGVPDWLLRAEAQDIVAEEILERLEE